MMSQTVLHFSFKRIIFCKAVCDVIPGKTRVSHLSFEGQRLQLQSFMVICKGNDMIVSAI